MKGSHLFMIKNVWQLKNVNAIKTIVVSIKTRIKVVCYRGAYFHMEKGSTLSGHANSIIHLNRSHYPLGYHNPGLLYMKKGSSIEISGRVSFGDGMKITVHNDGRCEFNNCVINNHCDIGIKSNLYIGSGTLIGDYCKIHDFDGHKIMNDSGEFKEGIRSIYIGENVWIGENVTILKGVTIGNNSVIGAGALVAKDVPEGSLVIGNPIKIIKKDIKWME